MKCRIAIIISAVLIAASVSAKTVKTTRTNLKPKSESVKLSTVKSDLTVVDSVCTDSVEVRGFDKPLYSVKETFLVTNKLSRKIVSLKLTINYIDIADRVFNSRTVTVDCNIPSGATRQLTIKSFDTQKSYYYIRSRRPRAQSTPFQVAITVDSATLK